MIDRNIDMIGSFIQIDIGARFAGAAGAPPGTAGIKVSVNDAYFHNIGRTFAGIGNRTGSYESGNGRRIL